MAEGSNANIGPMFITIHWPSNHLCIGPTLESWWPNKNSNIGPMFYQCIVVRLDGSSLSSDIQQLYNLTVQNKFDCLYELPDDVHCCWDTIREAVCKSADEFVGPRQNIRRPWLPENTYKIIQLNAAAKTRNDNAERKKLHGIFKTKAKADSDRNAYLSQITNEVEEELLHWLPVRQRIDYKLYNLSVITYRRSTGNPVYLHHHIHDYLPARTLRSPDKLLLTVLRISLALSLSTKSFSVSAPSVVYNCRCTELLNTFKRSLKTELFYIAYCKRENSAQSLPLCASDSFALWRYTNVF